VTCCVDHAPRDAQVRQRRQRCDSAADLHALWQILGLVEPGYGWQVRNALEAMWADAVGRATMLQREALQGRQLPQRWRQLPLDGIDVRAYKANLERGGARERCECRARAPRVAVAAIILMYMLMPCTVALSSCCGVCSMQLSMPGSAASMAASRSDHCRGASGRPRGFG
jgi:hypothetical protein